MADKDTTSADVHQGLVSQRRGIRRQIDNLWKKADVIVQGQIAYDEWELTKALRKLEVYAPQLQGLDGQILGYISDPTDRDTDIDNSSDYYDDVMDKIFAIQKSINDHVLPVPAPAAVVSGSSGGAQPQQVHGSFRFPKFEMSVFCGDPMKWRGWWDIYKSAIHDDPNRTGSQKFSYLIGYLKGNALKIAEGYELSDANYDHVIEELKERFGDKQRAQFAHFEALFSIEKAKSQSLSEVQRVSDECERHIRSLTALDVDEETFCVCFIPVLLKKLPTYLATKICEKNGAGKWSMANVRQWIKDDIRAREVGESACKGGNGFGSSNGDHTQEWRQKNWQQNYKQRNTASALAAPAQGSQNKRFCTFCQTSDHFSDKCTQYRDVTSRFRVVKSMRPSVCFLCFSHDCRDRRRCPNASLPCFYCKQTGHHCSLCNEKFGSISRNSGPPHPRGRGKPSHPGKGGPATQAGYSGSGASDKRDTPKKESANVAVAQGDDTVRDVAFLPTALVTALNETGTRTASGRVMIDSGSSRSYITERLCKKLCLENVGSTYLSIGKFGSNKRSTTVSKRVRFKIECADGSKQTVLANVTPIISCPVSRYPINPEDYPEMKNMKLGEPLNTRPDSLELDLLIGSDQMYNFTDTDTEKGLVFLGSRFGYLTSGVMPARQGDPISENTLVLLLTEAAPGEVGPEMFDLERFWKLEEAGTVNKKSIQMVEDEEAIKQFEETVRFEDGRYLALEGKGSSFARQLRVGIREAAVDVETPSKGRKALQGIRRNHPRPEVPTRTTTKVRIVNDASSKASKTANSLNDCLLRGQVLIEDLCGCLMRFRMNPIALVSDIEKAFLQVSLQSQERDVARFLWLKDPSKPPTRDNVETLRFARVFFGAISSPFLLGATLNHHLKVQKSEMAEKIRTNIYVDNVITGEDSVEKTVEHYRKAKGLFLGAAMNLREFFTNSEEVRREFASEDRGKATATKVLGLRWSCTEDTISCSKLREITTNRVTKREIMKQTAQLFDPCGFFAPVVLPGKLIVQEMWRLDLAWDEEVPVDIREKWHKVRGELESIPLHALARCIGDPTAQLELHVFCDASTVAAGAVVFLRKVCGKNAECDLVMAKSRLAPYKPVETIPRMELVALEMGVNLMLFVEQQLRLTEVKKYAWGDSQCVLSWLTKEKLPTRFVKNRVQNIRGKSSGIEFRYVPSKENPADVCSRGCTFGALLELDMWWKGPPWLQKTEESWPANRNPVGELLEMELPEPVTQLVSCQKHADPPVKGITDPQRYSSFSRLLRVTAYVKRFVKNLRVSMNDRKFGVLSVREIADARAYWVSLAQKQGFPQLPSVISVKDVKRGPLAQLNVFRDRDGILRCNTRLDKSGLPYDTRNPILLPKNHPLTDLVIREYHVTALHPGAAQTLSMVRQRYWVVHGRNQIRRVIRKCRRCRRIEGGPFAVPRTPALPQFRVTEQLPFAATGLDYLGFLNVRVVRNRWQKVWVCLFTCAVSRAVHFELVEDQSSEEFHLAMRRFFAAQGTPKLFNASQFTTVEMAMKKLWNELTTSEEFEEFVGTQSIECPRGRGKPSHPGKGGSATQAGYSGSGASDKRDTPKKESANVAVAQGDDTVRDVAFLPTALVTALNETGTRTASGRVMIDSGSSRSYITERLCKKLCLENVGSTYLSIGKFGSNKRSTTVSKRVRFKIECADGSKQTVLANVTPIISCPVSRYPINPEDYPEMKNMKLGEPLNTRPDSLELDLLIGSDQMYNFMEPTNVVDTEKGLVFLGSRFGYLTSGVMPARQGDPISENTLVLLLTEAAPGEVGPEMFDLERFWKLEEAGTVNKKSIQMVEDEEAINQFEETVRFEDGRYHVTWPWKEKDPVLPDNYELAFARLQSTWKRLQKDEKLFKEYDEIIQDQKVRGVLEKAPILPEGKVYHLPHHPFVVPTRTTTKVRIVNDASSKASKTANSLNDCLLRGQVLIEDLCGYLMRFRMNPIALVSDIEKAFLQVSLQSQERDVARFLWLKDPSKPPTRDNVETLRFARVFFGAISSPFFLGATLNHHLKVQKSEIAEKIRTNIYVDNVITGENSVEKTVEHYRKAKGLFLGAAINLREFFTNSEEVRREFASEDRGKATATKVLGLRWSCTEDTISCSKLREITTNRVTKREIMKQTAQLFDPCGFFAPVVLPGKLIVQELWRLDLAWDEEVPVDIRERWHKVRGELESIPLHALARCIGDPTAQLELHVFCDASTVAAGAVVFLRKVCGKNAECDLVMAKSRLAPYKPVETIPRMELVALEMGVNLMLFVEQQLRLTEVKKYAWGDSQCVLSWLTKEKLPTRFVKNRIQNIRGKSSGIEFRYVPSKENPADVCSRGCTFGALLELDMWWKGPPWLQKTEESWPANRNPVEELLEMELPEPVTQLVSCQKHADPPVKGITDPQRYSSFSRLLRVTAYVKRFVKNLRVSMNDMKFGVLSVREIADARAYWVSLAQKQGFPQLPSVISEKDVKRGPLAQLNVFRDRDGILRCNTRLDKSGLPYDTRNPILLPKNHPLTDLVIREYHVTALHPGAAQTLSMVRQRYWVVHGRNQIRRVIRKCRRCRRIEGGPFAVPRTPALPQFRVTEQLPFAATGLDYLGFLNVRVVRNRWQKVWVCLFTCAVSRAVHLELVEDQSSEEFHLAMRRFFAAQGTPKLFNASQFTTVEMAMKKLWNELTTSEEFEEFVGTQSIEWKKIPQVAPWMGGFYERLVGIVKKFLKKALDGVCVSSSELRTVLAEIQAIVNSRPLLYVEEGATSLQICPADLLGKTGRHDLPTFDETNVPTTSTTVNNVVTSWKRLQNISTNFWDVWRQGYLTSLRERQVSLKQRNPSELTPKVGCVVQIKDKKMPRAQWKLGKIDKHHESSDGNVRSVTLRLGNGRSITRPVKLLYPLEMQVDDLDDSGPEDLQDPMVGSNAPPDDDSPILADENDFWGFDDEDFAFLASRIAKVDEQIREVTSVDGKNTVRPSPRTSVAKNVAESVQNPTPRVSDTPELGPRASKLVALAKLRRNQSVDGAEQV